MLHRQLIDEVDDRVVDAEKSFRSELDDDIADLLLAARVLGNDESTRRAVAEHDAEGARTLARTFAEVYPDFDILFVDGEGKLIAQLGCNDPPETIGELSAFGQKPITAETRGVIPHGCERTAKASPPAYAIAEPVKGGGVVIVCMPLDKELIVNAAEKLGLEIAVVPKGSQAPIASSPSFPLPAIPAGTVDSNVFEGATTWAVGRFHVQKLVPVAGSAPPIEIALALDVGDIKKIVRNNLLFAILVLAVAASISIVTGARLASVMSRALTRVNRALKKLEQQEYVHVETLQTGDELEDLATGFNTMVDGLKERDKLRVTFGKYMTEAVMEHLLNGKVSLGGETLTVTILFTDIRSFTTISERMDAQALVALLNEYFTEMVTIVMEQDGVVDKYIGDAIMAVFGAPVPKPNDAIHAVRAAVKMRQALRHLNERLATRGMAPLKTGIGIHTGEVVAGNIGSEKRMEYTVIGDAVNLASRLESNTKELGVNILISEDTYVLTKDHIIAEEIREITVKGRARPVKTYAVKGLVGEKPLDESKPALSV
jgi:adenylate cyclase